MNLVEPKIEVLFPKEVEDIKGMMTRIEYAARVCYNSSMGKGNQDEFIRSKIKSGHESVVEHGWITVEIVCDRGISHDLVRHRLFSFSQQSTRYVNFYNGINYIDIGNTIKNEESREVWLKSLECAAEAYNKMIDNGEKPEIAKSVLPMSLATVIIVSGNVRQWRHFLKLRAEEVTGKVHPQMKKIADDILDEFHKLYGPLFEDIHK